MKQDHATVFSESSQGSLSRACTAKQKSARRRLSVLHVGKFYPPHMGGIETHLEALCGELRKSVDLRVIVSSSDTTASEEILNGVPVCRVPTQMTLASTPLCAGMISKIRNDRSDIIHLHLPNPMAVLAYLVSGHRGRLVITYHSDTIRQKVLGRFFEPLLHLTLRRSSAIIVTSPNYQKSSPVLGRYRDRSAVIPLGIALGEFQKCNPASVRAVREQFGERLVLSVGRLVYYKGFEYLIRSMTEVKGRLLIIGDGPLRGKLRELAASLNLGDKVIFAGHVPGSLSPYYHAASVFALPSISRSEAFGIVQIEAMAAGLPVVNTLLDSGVPFVSMHEETGLTVPPADAGALASALNRLLDDEALRNRLGAAAQSRAGHEFTVETMAQRTSELYEQLLPTNTDRSTSSG